MIDTADYNIAVKFEQFRKGLLDTTHAHLTESNNASIVKFMKLTAVDYFRNVTKDSADKYFLQANSYSLQQQADFKFVIDEWSIAAHRNAKCKIEKEFAAAAERRRIYAEKRSELEACTQQLNQEERTFFNLLKLEGFRPRPKPDKDKPENPLKANAIQVSKYDPIGVWATKLPDIAKKFGLEVVDLLPDEVKRGRSQERGPKTKARGKGNGASRSRSGSFKSARGSSRTGSSSKSRSSKSSSKSSR